MSEMAIQVKDLSKVYKLYNKPSDRLKETLGFHVDAREHYALKHVNFEIRKGETVGIIGTNGSGKSTILKIITGVLNPTGGEVNVDGRISALLELGAGFNMEYTGIENVYLNGTMLGFTKEEAYRQFSFLLDAFKYGVPPHAGLAYGLDRLVMLMAKVDSIRDVMAFPKVKDASCLMTNAPSQADDKQLAELGLELRPEESAEE